MPKTATMLSQKDVLGLRNMETAEIQLILDTARTMKQIILSNNKKTPHLQGKSVVTVFYENSTRTRLSFEMAGKYLSATVSGMSVAVSSVAKGESLIDTVNTLQVMGADVLILRHPISSAPHFLARHVQAAIINAGDGINEHPTQALLDMFTMLEKFGSLNGLKVAIIGDIRHSRVARSNIFGLTKMGAEVTVAGPRTLLPVEIEALGCRAMTDADEAVRGADVVMELRIQLERQGKELFPSIREYHKLFGLTEKRFALAKKDALVMHPGPINRGVEIASSVADGTQSVIGEQVTNGVAVRMALLYLVTRRMVDGKK